MWVRIIDAGGIPTIAEVVSRDPALLFTPGIASKFVPAEEGMIYRAELRDGVWVPPPPPDPPTPPPIIDQTELLAAQIREQRNKLLAESDWTQLPDSPVDSAAWAVYRQALRDITSQEGFPTSVEWPVPPA